MQVNSIINSTVVKTLISVLFAYLAYFVLECPTICPFVPENKDFGQFVDPIFGILSNLVQYSLR